MYCIFVLFVLAVHVTVADSLSPLCRCLIAFVIQIINWLICAPKCVTRANAS